MNKGSILFSSAYLYLAKPQFFAITPHIKDYHKVFLNVRDPMSQRYSNEEINQVEFLKYFDDFQQVDSINFDRKSKRENLRIYRKYKKLLTDSFNKINPLAVVSCSDMSLSDRILFQLCKKKEIPFFILQPAFIKNIYKKKGNLLTRFLKIIINKFSGVPIYRKQHLFGNESDWTYLFLWSENFVEKPKRKNMFIMGNPAFDYLFQNFSVKQEFKNNILICTQDIENLVGEKLFNQVIEIYMEAIRSRPNLNFYIKFHPRENIEKYKNTLNSGKYENVKVVKEGSLYELLELSDAQMSVNSFTSFEAAAMGIPIIIVNPNNELNFFDHFREEINLKVIHMEQIGEALDKIISKEYWKEFSLKREQFFKKLLFSTDGQSGKRVADKIIELIKKSTDL
ncbi:MAG: hypothetical protein ACFFD5_12055 [Candidatus Thorarchaeota archaeon]